MAIAGGRDLVHRRLGVSRARLLLWVEADSGDQDIFLKLVDLLAMSAQARRN